ncbi:zinc-ribbon domain-containing protein [Streptomyces sp. NBC_00424]|uniref:zinc-ribbon domain-containing protein n=1 Tax=unclassified Streptomyces TaxID=2593676 RepID=UPI00338F21F0
MAAPGKSLADVHPDLAAEFVHNLENELTSTHLKPQSGYRCRWRCRACGNEWVATPQSRVAGNTGCPACFQGRRGKARRQPKPFSQTARDVLGVTVSQEFVRNVTTPESDLTQLRPGSGDKCEWNCSSCGNVWVATVASRVRSHRNREGSGCRKCYDRRIAIRRRLPQEGDSLKERHPRISQTFVRNITTPGEGPERLRPGSNDRCQWRCPNGHEWEALVLARTYGSECPRCASAGRSRFELEVCFLLEAATGTEVLCDYEVKQALGTSGRPARVDLFLPTIALHVDLDPLHTHNSHRSHANDVRKSVLLADLNYVRLRAHGLPLVPGVAIRVDDATRNGIDPWIWASSLSTLMIAHGLPFELLSNDHITQRLREAAEAWAELKGKVRYPSVAELHPHLLVEFRKNITNPLFDLSVRSPSSFDVVEWGCSKCGNTWESSIRNRAAKGSGCHACYRQGVHANNVRRSIAPTSESLAALKPEIASRFIRCLKDSGRTPENLRLNSNLQCEWYCHTGRHTFTATVCAVARVARRRCCR